MKRKCYITGRRLAIKGMVPLMTYQGEDIEVKVKRITENNEPIKDGAPITYTEKNLQEIWQKRFTLIKESSLCLDY